MLLARARSEGDPIKTDHLKHRSRSERDYFGPFFEYVPDHSNPKSVPDASVNDPVVYEEVGYLDPNQLVTYSGSLVRKLQVSEYEGHFLNVLLGLSPY